MRLRCSLIILAVVSSLPASAQLTAPKGWSMQTAAGGAVVMFSPGFDPAARIAITLLPPWHTAGEVKAWFANQTVALAQASGHPLGATEVKEQEGILVRAVQIENQAHKKLRVVFYGYQSPGGLSIPVVMIPGAVKDADPRLDVANQYVQQLAAQKFELAPPPPAPAMQPGPPQGGDGVQPPHTDIDLTYHAKSLISKDRDVPLKGVYVFVGYAFGATYGGVGTTMTWGQHAVQQLLLLFANGVAAKTDINGGNIAGHHEAEGFATMDVSNPTAIGGAPFGHWTEEGNTIHIKWNYAAPTDLVKTGSNLEGKGERWTPFQLAEGDRLEGTFVRKMEAGLRSQWIMLHQNGTFSGDGVNVTMGGSIVSPAFPERGSGMYEVHKGSMILAFSNGFTQAIGCIIDKAPNGDAKTILLNGFPFERVR